MIKACLNKIQVQIRRLNHPPHILHVENPEFVKEYDLIQPELKKIREEINQNILQESKITIEK